MDSFFVFTRDAQSILHHFSHLSEHDVHMTGAFIENILYTITQRINTARLNLLTFLSVGSI